MSSTVVLIDLLGAGALLLWGLRMVKTGVTRAFGGKLRLWLATATRNRFLAFGVGLTATVAIQSSTATALMAASFASRELITSAMGQAIMLGANVGTSLVTQVLALDIHWLSPLFVLIGVAVFQSSESSKRHAIGRAVIGLGLMLLSLHLLGSATVPIRDSSVMRSLLTTLDAAPFVAVIIAAVLAIAASSSLAIVLFVMSLAASGAVSPQLTIALVLGANLGGAIPPYLATASYGPLARRITLGNLAVRLIGTMTILALLDPLSARLMVFEPDAGRLAIDVHVAFNLFLSLIFLPLIGPLSTLMARLLPLEKAPDGGPRHLDESALDTPAVALSCAARETLRMGDRIDLMLTTSLNALHSGDLKQCTAVEKQEAEVDMLYKAVKLYLARLGREGLDDDDGKRSTEIISYAINLEHIGDILEKNLNELISKKIRQQVWFSDEGFTEITQMYALTIENIRIAQGIFVSRDANLARRLLDSKAQVHDIERESSERHLQRLRDGLPETLQTSSLHLDVLRDLKRINAHIRSVAYPVLEDMRDAAPSVDENALPLASTAQSG